MRPGEVYKHTVVYKVGAKWCKCLFLCTHFEIENKWYRQCTYTYVCIYILEYVPGVRFHFFTVVLKSRFIWTFCWYLVEIELTFGWIFGLVDICEEAKGSAEGTLRLPLIDRPTTFQKMPKVSPGRRYSLLLHQSTSFSEWSVVANLTWGRGFLVVFCPWERLSTSKAMHPEKFMALKCEKLCS